LAKSLSGRRESTRDKDAKGAKTKKLLALEQLKREKKVQKEVQAKMEESEDDSLDFGDDDDDSDDDYEDSSGLKPWQKKAAAAQKSKSRLGRDDSDDDMDIDADDEVAPQQKKSRPAVNHPSTAHLEAGLDDFLKVVIPRRRLARWCNEPFFEAAVLECYVRLFIGEDDSGEKVYRLCEIVDVKVGSKSYKFPVASKNDKPIATNKQLTLKFGTSTKNFPMYLVSDAPPTESDVLKYVTALKNNGRYGYKDVLSKRYANKLRRLQDDLVNNYVYTKEDIEKNLEERKKLGKSGTNLGLEQTKCAIAVQGAQDAVNDLERRVNDTKRKLLEVSGDGDMFKELKATLAEVENDLKNAIKNLEDRKREEDALKRIVDKRKDRLTKRKRDQNWAKVNERALQTNQRVDREANKDQKEGTVTAAGGAKVEFNPYARRRVKPKILWEVGQDKEENKQEEDTTHEDTKESREEAPKEDAPNLVHERNEKAATFSEIHQFAIDEEGMVESSASNIFGFGSTRSTATSQRVRKGISLSDYLERKAKGTL
jgi:RNA polymerase-associated protein RTF1